MAACGRLIGDAWDECQALDPVTTVEQPLSMGTRVLATSVLAGLSMSGLLAAS